MDGPLANSSISFCLVLISKPKFHEKKEKKGNKEKLPCPLGSIQQRQGEGSSYSMKKKLKYLSLSEFTKAEFHIYLIERDNCD